MHFSLTIPESNSRLIAILRAVFGWIAYIPVIVFLLFAYIGYAFVGFYGFVALVVSGKYPKIAFDYRLGLTRFSIRVQLFFYGMSDNLPSFDFSNNEDDIFELDIEPKESYSRIMVIVIALSVIFYSVLILLQTVWLGIRQIVSSFLAWLSFWVILVTGKYPEFAVSWITDTIKYEIKLVKYEAGMDQKYPGDKKLIVVNIILFVILFAANQASKQYLNTNTGNDNLKTITQGY